MLLKIKKSGYIQTDEGGVNEKYKSNTITYFLSFTVTILHRHTCANLTFAVLMAYTISMDITTT